MIFYVHHYYTYELFWYFFHGVAVDVKNDVPTWTYENRYNKNIKIKETIKINCSYKNNDITVYFVNENDWDKDDGYHIFDYNINLIENNLVADRGWNSILNLELKNTINLLNSKYLKYKNNIIFFYINWEPHFKTEIKEFKKLNKNIMSFIDESTFIHSNQFKSETHVLSSFIFPDTIGLREYYFFADYLKYYKNYDCKINFPIRRIVKEKNMLVRRINKMNNDNIRVSVSSFTDSNQFEIDENRKTKLELLEEIKKIEKVNYIQKRGYNLDDWGGEWNDNNTKEFMWKLLTYSEVNIIPEFSKKRIDEKSVKHILSAKPFIPYRLSTINYYNSIFKMYNLEEIKFPFEYVYIFEILEDLNKITKDTKKWNILKSQLQKCVDDMRYNFIEVIHNNNGMIDKLIEKNTNKSLL